MPWVAGLIIGGASLLGSALSKSSADKQASTVQQASAESTALQREMFNTNRADLKQAAADSGTIYDAHLGAANNAISQGRDTALGFIKGGVGLAQEQLAPESFIGRNALWKIGALSGANGADAARSAQADFTTSPGYQFQMDQGLKAVDRSAAARGGLLGGRAVKAAETFGSGLAASEYGNYYNRLAGVAGIGTAADSQLAGYQNAYGQAAGNIIANAGQQMGGWQMNAGTGKANALFGAATNTATLGANVANATSANINNAAANTASIYGNANTGLVNNINQTGNNLLYSYGRGWLGGTGGTPNQYGTYDTDQGSIY